MTMPTDIAIVDTMLGIPSLAQERWYDFMKPQLLDEESRRMFSFPAEYMFKDVPRTGAKDDFTRYTLEQMDRVGIEKALIGFNFELDESIAAMKNHPDRFYGSYQVNPNLGMEGVRDLRRAVEEFGCVAATAFPAGYLPQVPINDKKFYPFYAACVDLDVPIFVCAGVPGPRLPMACQDVSLIDEVCYFFPELKFVTRHGCEPWQDLAVKLMLKYPNLYYSTSAFAPKYYPKAIVDYANTRGADKVMYAGYYPMGLSLERIFTEMRDVPFRDHVWPRFLRENALRVFKLDG
jgi:predicted TIM-barrel fold metal-dependent hydrolase